jgi:VIT1/CCC1 family predicted Fe2+/Mn2+ transporter
MSTEANDLRDRPIGEVAGLLTRDLSRLIRQELELAKAEMGEKARKMAPGAALATAAVVVALCAAGALTAFVVLVLALFLDAWLAALITGVALAVVAGGMAWAGKERVQDVGMPVPEQTIETVKEDAQWMKEQAQSGRR